MATRRPTAILKDLEKCYGEENGDDLWANVKAALKMLPRADMNSFFHDNDPGEDGEDFDPVEFEEALGDALLDHATLTRPQKRLLEKDGFNPTEFPEPLEDDGVGDEYGDKDTLPLREKKPNPAKPILLFGAILVVVTVIAFVVASLLPASSSNTEINLGSEKACKIPAWVAQDSACNVIFWQVFPRPEVVGTPVYKCLDLLLECKTGPLMSGGIHEVVALQGKVGIDGDSVVMVETKEGIYFMPSSSFNFEDATPLTGSSTELKQFVEKARRLDKDLYQLGREFPPYLLNMLYGGLILALVGLLLERVLIEDLPLLLIIIPGIWMLVSLTKALSNPGDLWKIHIFGFLFTIGCGYVRGPLNQARSLIERTAERGDKGLHVSAELRHLLNIDVVGTFDSLLRSIQWSNCNWWVLVSIALGILSPESSPLFMIFPAYVALGIHSVEAAVVLVLESLKRGEDSDKWMVGLTVLFAGISFAGLFVARYMGLDENSQYLGMAILALIALVLVIIVAASGGFDMHERDRIGEGFQYIGVGFSFAIGFFGTLTNFLG